MCKGWGRPLGRGRGAARLWGHREGRGQREGRDRGVLRQVLAGTTQPSPGQGEGGILKSKLRRGHVHILEHKKEVVEGFAGPAQG